MKSFKQIYKIKASVNKVFDALTNPVTIEKWSESPAEMDNKKGSNFNLWNGFITGTNIEVIQNKKLAQNWYGGNWELPSVVTFDLNENPDETSTLILTHENVPEDSEYDFEKGWKEYYIGKIIKMFEENISR